MLKEYIVQLSKELGLSEELQPSAEGTFLLNFSSNLRISLRENKDSGITLHALLGLLPAKESEEFMLILMKANLLGKETGGAILGLDKEGKEITLSYFLSPSAPYKEFRDALEDFVNYAESWQKETLAFASTH